MSVTSTNVAESLLADKDPERIALSFLQSKCSYGELDARSRQVASSLIRIGGRKGDRALLLSDNSLFGIASYLGIMRAGLVCVPLPANLPSPDLKHILEITEAGIVFAQSSATITHGLRFSRANLITDVELGLVPNVTSQQSFSEVCANAPAVGALPEVGLDDLAALVFTSGSTGQPRGVMVSHGNIIANTESIIEYLRLTKEDRIMAVLPFHYCYGASLLHTHFKVGGEVVVDSRFMYPETILQRMIDAQCTGFAGVPSHFQILLRNSSIRKKKFPHLRYVQQAGGYLAPSFIRDLKETLPNTQIFIMYGQTEATARLSYLPPEFLDTRLGSIGKGIPGVKLRVINELGHEVKPGEVGEIAATGANVARGYWRAPEESAVTFRDGTLHTGDLARVDEDGFLYVVDRAKDFLKCRGERVSCRQIEEQLLAFDELVEAAVIGIPDEVFGEAVKAFVVPRVRDSTGLTERLAIFCKGRMPPHHLPKEIIVLSALPKNSAGKVLKASLKAA